MACRLPILLAVAFPVIAAAFHLRALPARSIRPTTNPGYLSFPIIREPGRGTSSLSARDATAPLTNEQDTSYLIQLTFGSNAQPVKLAIDTGSDELFVNPNCNDTRFTDDQQKACTDDGRYNPRTSSTSRATQENSQITYGSGSVNIQYVFDTVGIPSAHVNITDVQFGVATDSQNLNEGILGLGFGNGINLNYSNFVDQLAAQHVTNTKAFSVALGTSDTSGGNIIFGGVDTKKYAGALVTSDIPRSVGRNLQRYTVQLKSLSFQNAGRSNTYARSDLSVVLDTGSSLCLLPSSIVSSMASDFRAQLDSASGLLVVSCDLREQNGTLDFAFEGLTIHVPFRHFILQAGAETCVLGVQPVDTSSGVTALLGDSFLRAAYVVFDQTNMKISLAQYVDCGSHEQPIPSGSDGASGLGGECSPSSSSSSSGAGNKKSAADLNKPAAVRSAVGLVVGIAALVILL